MMKGLRRNEMKANLGVGAICKVQFRYLNPRKVKENKFLNKNHKNKVEVLLVMYMSLMKINCAERRYVMFDILC